MRLNVPVLVVTCKLCNGLCRLLGFYCFANMALVQCNSELVLFCQCSLMYECIHQCSCFPSNVLESDSIGINADHTMLVVSFPCF